MERMYFIGVSTGASSINELFPRWATALGLQAELVGVDLPLGASRDAVRAAVSRIRDDPGAGGALVTSHKVGMVDHAGDLFVVLDEWAERCREVSCLTKRADGLHASALDPHTSWKSFAELAGADHFARHPDAEVLCLGAGGSGTAFTSRLLTVESPPARIHVTDRSSERLDFLSRVHSGVGADVDVAYHPVDVARDNDSILGRLAPHSVVVNATGMGKDRPGSPLTDGATLPEDGVVWEFNYRGSLEFLHQARRQREERRLRLADGWRYFLHGWATHMAEVFGFRMDEERFEELAAIAQPLRSPG